MTLEDEVVVYPAHGAGSACGKNMSKETTDTLGHQKKTNYALRADMTKEEFIKDYKLSRYICYLIVQNANSKKKMVALGQTYFAIQTRKQEFSEKRI